jgi:hypothetical protein
MSLRATIWGWTQNQISSTQKIVLLDLCDRAGKQNTCWPKQATIASRVRLTERAVHSALAVLVQKGLIKRSPRTRNGKRTSDMVTVLVDGLPPPSIASEIAPAPPLLKGTGLDLPNETDSGGRLNDLHVSTGMTFSGTCNEEPSRLNRAVPRFPEMMPEPDRPDIDRRIYVARLLNQLFSQEIGAAIDWSSPGIDDLDEVIEWLKIFEEEEVTSCLARVADRNHKSKSEPIRSWRYFESEIYSIGKLEKDK